MNYALINSLIDELGDCLKGMKRKRAIFNISYGITFLIPLFSALSSKNKLDSIISMLSMDAPNYFKLISSFVISVLCIAFYINLIDSKQLIISKIYLQSIKNGMIEKGLNK